MSAHPCVVWYQCDYRHGPVAAFFDDHREMCAYLAGWMSQPGSKIVEFTPHAVQVQ